jgi:GNAT superfamily N-acetyltransferase
MSMKVRAFNKEDSAAVKKMLLLLNEYADGILPENLKKFEQCSDVEKTLDYCLGLNEDKNKWKTFICESGEGEIVGFITGGIDQDLPGFKISRYGNIEIFFVMEPFRGKGAGRMLLDSIQEWFSFKGCDAVRVDTWLSNSSAIEAYQKMGFAVAAVLMVKKI